jgi:hypothetical protein
MAQIHSLKLDHVFNDLKEYQKNFNYTYYKYLYNCYNIYIEVIHSLNDLFRLFERVLYYKYYVQKKGVQEKYNYNLPQKLISQNDYEYIYKLN